MAISPGTKLGSYEVTSALGAGGMGEVYQGVYADTRFIRMPRHPTPAASDNRCLDVPATPNPVERFV